MLTSDPKFDRFFRKLVENLNPYLGELVCIGGGARMRSTAIIRLRQKTVRHISEPWMWTGPSARHCR